MSEDLYDRLRLQPNWDLSKFAGEQLVICGRGGGMARTLSMAALCCGWPRVAFVAAGETRARLLDAAEAVTRHAGPAGWLAPVHPPAYAAVTPACRRRWVIDAGDPACDGIEPAGEPAFYYAATQGIDGAGFIAVGPDRRAVGRRRKGTPVGDRAEVPAAAALVLAGVFAAMGVCDELPAPAPVSRIPLPDITGGPDPAQISILYAGGGGAIAHQEMWAAHLDPVLRRAARLGRAVVVDPKLVHESCRSRQWGYERGDLHAPKAEATALWLETLFPGLRVRAVNERLAERHFAGNAPAEALASIDNWSGRKALAAHCGRFGLPWWSAGSSFMGGYARQVSAQNPFCASADEGVERLASRADDDGLGGGSCTAAETPQPSSVLPQMVIGSFIACCRREVLLGRADPKALARGIEVHLTHPSRKPGFEGLPWSPGRMVNTKIQRALPSGERGCRQIASGF